MKLKTTGSVDCAGHRGALASLRRMAGSVWSLPRLRRKSFHMNNLHLPPPPPPPNPPPRRARLEQTARRRLSPVSAGTPVPFRIPVPFRTPVFASDRSRRSSRRRRPSRRSKRAPRGADAPVAAPAVSSGPCAVQPTPAAAAALLRKSEDRPQAAVLRQSRADGSRAHPHRHVAGLPRPAPASCCG